jgi:hypothetical protein
MRPAFGLRERTAQFQDSEYVVVYYPTNERHQTSISSHGTLCVDIFTVNSGFQAPLVLFSIDASSSLLDPTHSQPSKHRGNVR